MKQKYVLIISAGILPIPANRGGAVEELIDIFLENNAQTHKYKVAVASCVFSGIENKKKVPGVQYYYYRAPFYALLADKLYALYSDKIKKDWRSLFRQHNCQSRHYINHIVQSLDLDIFDVIIVENNMSLLKRLYETLGKSFSRKCMYHMHSTKIDNRKMIPYIARCRRVLAVSEFVRDHLYETVPEFANTDIIKVTNGIQIRLYSDEQKSRIRSAMRARYGIGKDETVFLFVGRVSPEKGVLQMLKAFVSSLPEFEHRSRLFVVGSAVSGSNEESYYYRQIKDIASRYPDNITMTGYVEHASITDYHIMSDAQIVPSIMEDPAPLTVLEGMSMGIFLLLSRVGGIPEYAGAYENKIFFLRNDSFMSNIKKAFLQYDREWAPHRYSEVVCLFSEKQYYNEFAEAIDVT